MLIAPLLAVLALLQDPPELKLKDFEYDAAYAATVKACAEAERRIKEDPAGALKALEEQLKAAPPDPAEALLVVIYSKGVTKGAVKEKVPFLPWKVAGRLALAADLPERAVECFAKSPSSAELLAEARRAVEEKKRRTADPGRAPGFDAAPWVAASDYAGGLKALAARYPEGGAEHDRHRDSLKREAAEHQRARISVAAARLFRLADPEGPREIARLVLDSCSKVPADWELPELAWMRELEAWGAKPDADGLDRLALAAAKLDPSLGSVLRIAQERRLVEAEALVAEAGRASREARVALLERLAGVERAFGALAALRDEPGFRERLAAAKARLPIDPEVLARARAGASRIEELRALADELDRLWTSAERSRLSAPDAAELALRLGIARCEVLFLDGRRPEEVARDPRVAEVFRIAPPLPEDVSPRISAARKLAK